MSASDNAHLLSILEAHGKSFLDSVSGHTGYQTANHGNVEQEAPLHKRLRLSPEYLEEEEWRGIQPSAHDDHEEDSDIDDPGSASDDDFRAESNSGKVIIFSDPSLKKAATVTRAQQKAFMSSKISKLQMDIQEPQISNKPSKSDEEDKSNARNDALLHKLVHTKLLSGSANTELDLTPAQRRKALAGRVLEVSGAAVLGKGESIVRNLETNRAAKRIREGIARKQRQRQGQELEDAKNLGNYHPSLKRVFDASRSASPRKRQKGLAMGIGKFSNGSLRLTKDDISQIPREKSRSDRDGQRKRK